VAGDLEEEYAETVLPSRGALRADLWFWGQTVRTLWAFRRGPGGRGGPPFLPPILRDFAHARRGLLRRPGFALLAVGTLAVGIGAVTSVFGLTDAILLRPVRGVQAPEHLATLHFRAVDGSDETAVSLANLQDLEAGAPAVVRIAGYTGTTFQASGEGLAPRNVHGEVVTGGYFPLLGVTASKGRLFAVDEIDGVDGPAVVVLSNRFWRGALGADEDVVGRTLRLNGTTFTVIGVAAPGFKGTDRLDDVELWVPGSRYATLRHLEGRPGYDPESRRLNHFMRSVIRVREDATDAQAEAELRAAMARLIEVHPDEYGIYAELVPTVDRGIGLDVGTRRRLSSILRILAVLALVVLGVACANVAGLLLLQGFRRQGETAVRRALGAAPGHLAVRHLVEAFLLAFPAAALGLALSMAMNAAMGKSGLFPDGVGEQVTMDFRVFAFAVGTAAVTALVFGAVPALLAARVDVNAALKAARRPSSTATRSLQSGLIVVQLSLAVVLVAGAVLLGRTVENLNSVQLGFEPEGVLAFQYDPGPQGYGADEIARFHRAVLEKAGAFPGVAAAAADTYAPFSFWGFGVELRHPVDPSRKASARLDWVSDGFFSLLAVPVLAGRAFTRDETLPSAGKDPQVAVLGRTLALELFGTPERALGRRLDFASSRMPSHPVVVGVVEDFIDGNLRRDPRAKLYLPLPGAAQSPATLLLRTPRPVAEVESDVRRALASADPNVPVLYRMDLSEGLSRATARERTFLDLFAQLSAVAVLLAVAGLYSVVAYAAAQRRREFGVRLALGASGLRLTRLIIGHSLSMGVAGVGVGVGLALLGRQVLAGVLFGVEALDLPSLGAAAGVLLAVAFLAGVIPALQAMRVDPAAVLRAE